MPSGYINFILFFLIVVFGFGDAPVFSDPDTAWHIASGDLIRMGHKLPLYDNWSFTSQGDTWYNLSWLFDCALSLMFSYGGFSAVYAVTVILFAGSIAMMAWHCVRLGASPVAVVLLVLPVTFVVFTCALARPNLCSIVLTVVFFYILSAFRDHGKRCALLILPLFMCLWVNLHGGFLLAFPLIGFFLLEALLDKNRKSVTQYALVMTFCLVATLINPYGFAVYYGAYKTLAAPFNHSLIEWQPVAIGHNIQMTLLLLIVLVAGNLLDKKIAFSNRAIALFMIMLALSSFRHAAIAALLLMPYLALRISELLYGSGIGARIRRLDSEIALDMEKTGARIVSALMVLFACIIVYVPHPRDEILKEPAGFAKDHFPADEATYVAEHYPNKHFFNSYNIGGYLDYLWRGKVKVFVDGRANSLYSDELLNDYQDFASDHGFNLRSERIVRQYGFDGLIIAKDDKDSALWNSNPEWKMVYAGKAAMVFLRK